MIRSPLNASLCARLYKPLCFNANSITGQPTGSLFFGAPSPARTDDLPLTRRMLYQLSYRGADLADRTGFEPVRHNVPTA